MKFYFSDFFIYFPWQMNEQNSKLAVKLLLFDFLFFLPVFEVAQYFNPINIPRSSSFGAQSQYSVYFSEVQ